MTGLPATDSTDGSGVMGAPASSYLKAKIKIGSCKGPISYGAEQQVFHHDDIPEKSRARKKEVREWAKSKILSADRQNWDIGTNANLYPVCERRQAENMIKDRSFPYQYNFRAETLDYACVVEPVDQPGKFHISRTNLADLERIKTAREDPKEGAIQRGRFRRNQEMPTHPNMVDATPWNNGTQFSPKEKERTLTRMTQTARASTAKVSKRLTGSKDYMKPRRQSDKLANDIREMKKSGTFKPDYGNTDKKGSTTNNATPSSTVVNAYKDEFKNRYSIEPSRKYHSTQHSGVWEYSKIDGRHMWSDTGSFVFDSRGDVIKKHNPDAFNLENPTLSKPLRTGLVDVNHVDHR